MSECFSSLTALFRSGCESIVAVLLFLLGIVATGLYRHGIPWIWKHAVLRFNFDLQFIDHPPPDHSLHNRFFPYSLPIGRFKVCCIVQAAHSFNAIRLNFRFLNMDESDANTSIIEINKVAECECDPRNLESVLPDTVGGMDGWYKNNAPPFGSTDARYFWITGKASSPWNGYLSVRMHDPSGFRSYGRHEVTASELPTSPLLSEASPTPFMSMEDAATALYTETRGRQLVLAKMAEEQSGWGADGPAQGAPDDILNWMAKSETCR